MSPSQAAIGSDNGLSPVQRQVIIYTNTGLLSIGSLGIYLSEISIEIQEFSLIENPFESIVWKISVILARP